jgi:hypothetical protein
VDVDAATSIGRDAALEPEPAGFGGVRLIISPADHPDRGAV